MAFDDTQAITPLEDLLNAVVAATLSRIQADIVTVPVAGSGANDYVDITFPVEFPGPLVPAIGLTVNSSVPASRTAATYGVVSLTGFRLYVSKPTPDPGSINVAWVAVLR